MSISSKYLRLFVYLMPLFTLLTLVWATGCEPPKTTPRETPALDGSVGESSTETIVDEQKQEKPAPPKVNLFDDTRLLKIEIELAVADWDAIRFQERSYDNLLEPNCRDKPFESGFTYRKATVTVDGTRVANAGVRKKGFVGSIDSNKPSLKVKFDEYVKGQELHGLERMTLNNNRSDRSFVKQCLAYQVFRKAGIPAPRCNFAHVFINGKSLGLFTHLESVKKRFLKQHFEDSSGRLYEGTLSDFRKGFMGTFEPKTLEDSLDPTKLEAVQQALDSKDEGLLAALKPHINVDRFANFWAAEVLINHLDGYAGNINNFYLYDDPKTSQFVFMPWGVDATFVNSAWQPQGAPPHIFAKGNLPWRLYRYPPTQKTMIAALQRLLKEVWNEADLRKQIDAWESTFQAVAIADRAHGGNAATFKEELDKVRDFIDKRRAVLQAIVDKPPAYNADLPKIICLTPNGEMSGTVSTSFGTLDQKLDPFTTGTGSIKGSSLGQPVTTTRIGAKAGYDPKQPGIAFIQLFLQISQTDILVVAIGIYDGDAKLGEPFPLRGPLKGGKTVLVSYNVQTNKSIVRSVLWEGDMTLTKAGNKPGDPIVGSFNIKWVTAPTP